MSGTGRGGEAREGPPRLIQWRESLIWWGRGSGGGQAPGVSTRAGRVANRTTRPSRCRPVREKATWRGQEDGEVKGGGGF